jgi:hypothetical protein
MKWNLAAEQTEFQKIGKIGSLLELEKRYGVRE